ncbi:type IV secretion system protein [Gilliamella sp. BG6]|uniref:type IV secretion system protein n=1 Tax=unclassified Gilliamella TaxID=2685620 RepID=UPI003986650C
MKKILILIALCSSSVSVFAGGIPTIDVASIAQLQLEAAEQAKRWTETVKQYKDQLKTQRDTLAAQTGVRDIADLVKESSSYFKDAQELQKWINNPKKILELGFDSLNADLKKIYKSYGLDNLCSSEQNSTNSFVAKERKNCEGQIVLMTLRQQQADNNLKAIDERVKTINKIAKKMAQSKDQKESLDLNNAMNTQLALLQADKLKMDIQVQQSKLQSELIEKEKEDLFNQQLELGTPKRNPHAWGY